MAPACSFRTLVNLSYPPHVVAVGCLYLAALLQSFEQGTSPERPNQHTSHEIAATLSKSGEWEKQFQVQIADIEEIAHAVVDLLITFSQNPAANTSPATPSSPHPHHSHSRGGHGHGHAPPAPVYAPYKADQLIRLKIVMRETEHAARVRGSVEEPNYEASDSPFYRNDRTVRYMFAPADLVDDPS